MKADYGLIRVAILDDHQGIIDGYLYRFSKSPDIEVVATIRYGEELEPTLKQSQVDVLILDVQVPISAGDKNPFPILYVLPKIIKAYPSLSILVITMHAQRSLIKALLEAGVNGYILKEDQTSIRNLASIIRLVAEGEMYMSQSVTQLLISSQPSDFTQPLSPRQLEALALCAAYPNDSTLALADRMEIESSTMRNLLSGAYLKLGVRTRAAAIMKAQKMGLIPSQSDSMNFTLGVKE